MALADSRLSRGVWGTMCSGSIKVAQGLNNKESQFVHKKLKDAWENGYDSCIVTNQGIYVTKRLSS